MSAPPAEVDVRTNKAPTVSSETAAPSPNNLFPATPAPLSSSVGQTLRTAREAKGFSVLEVAQSLKLGASQVLSLETDDWPKLPCNTILRGFVRNYARLVALDPAPLMTALNQLQTLKTSELEISVGTPVKQQRETTISRSDTVRVVAGLTVLLLALGAYFFSPQDAWQDALKTIKTMLQPRNTLEPPRAVSVPNSEVAPQTNELLAPPPTSPASNTVTEPPPPEPLPVEQPPPAPPNTLVFNFAKSAWVEVRDKSGQVIFSQINPAGSQREIQGQPPFTLVIGNSTKVSLQYKGKTINIPKQGRDDVARLTLD